MKKIIYCLFFLMLFGCGGYTSLFSTKNLSFYLDKIENINDDSITKKISRNLDSNKIKIDNKKIYILKISSNKKNNITSKNSKGEVLTYEMIIDVRVEVFYGKDEFPFETLNFKNNFNYNSQVNKFNLNQYKKNIEKNIVNKISQELIIKLQTL